MGHKEKVCLIDSRSPFRTSGGYTAASPVAAASASTGRPPLPTRCSSADRSSSGSLISMQRSTSVERSLMASAASANAKPPPHSNSVHVIGFSSHATNEPTTGTNKLVATANADKNSSSNIARISPTHYAVPKAAGAKIRIQLVPDFHKETHDMGKFCPKLFGSSSSKKVHQTHIFARQQIRTY